MCFVFLEQPCPLYPGHIYFDMPAQPWFQRRFNRSYPHNESDNYRREFRNQGNRAYDRNAGNSRSHHKRKHARSGDALNHSGSDKNEHYAYYATLLMAVVKDHDRRKLLFESGASNHMISDLSLISGLYEIPPKTVILGNRDTVIARQRGKLIFHAILSGAHEPECVRPFTIEDVIFVPDLQANLVSLLRILDDPEIVVNAKQGKMFFVKRCSRSVEYRKVGYWLLHTNGVRPKLV